MSNLKNEKTEIPCPGGGRPIQTTFNELSRKTSLKSNKGHEYKFKSSDQSKLRRALDDIEKLQDNYVRNLKKLKKEFGKNLEKSHQRLQSAYQQVVENADIVLKR